jgi:hypothetical protein
MPVQIRPKPDEAERKAILAALAAEEEEARREARRETFDWAAMLLPVRDEEEREP